MQSHSSYQNYPRSVYPGEYVPSFNREELRKELKKPHDGLVVQPFVNLSEQENYCKIEVAMPGLQREDFFINIDDNILSIAVLHKKDQLHHGEEKFQLHEFNYECFSRHIILPDNVEKEFLRAEYNEGILVMHLLKTQHPSKSAPMQVMVY